MPQTKTITHVLAGLAAVLAGLAVSPMGTSYLHTFGLSHAWAAPIVAAVLAAAAVYHNPKSFS